jgi:Asp-tRNA(Asn)/Glu-tRNA(Gln) amidotransferase A subunit family amidase
VPLLVKDLIDTAGIRTTYASSIYRDHVPARTAPAVAALEAEGAIVVAKANADEFAWGVCGQNVHYGDTVNPVAPTASPAGRAAATQPRSRPGWSARSGHRHRRVVRVPAAASASSG